MVDGSVRGGDFSWPQAGTSAGHHWGPHLATSGDFFMATDKYAPERLALYAVAGTKLVVTGMSKEATVSAVTEAFRRVVLTRRVEASDKGN